VLGCDFPIQLTCLKFGRAFLAIKFLNRIKILLSTAAQRPQSQRSFLKATDKLDLIVEIKKAFWQCKIEIQKQGIEK
jgi:hypothetical protein